MRPGPQVRLLELKAAQLEGSEEGSGPLEEDLRALQQEGLAPRHAACIVYRWAARWSYCRCCMLACQGSALQLHQLGHLAE
jgi:hypothetical protein